jgi:thioredoxin 1
MRVPLVIIGLCAVILLAGCPAKAPAAPPAPTGKAFNWLTNFAEAQGQARTEKKQVLADFCADWCGPCRMLDETTWKDAAVQAELARFVCVKVNVDENQAVAQKYGINGIPTIIAMTPDGKVLHQETGYVEAKDMVQHLKAVK